MVKYNRKRSKKYIRKRSKKYSRKRSKKYSHKRSKKYSRKKTRQRGGSGKRVMNPLHLIDYKPSPQHDTLTPSLLRAENQLRITNAKIFGQNSMKIYKSRIDREEKADILKLIENNLKRRFPNFSEVEKKAFFEGVNEIYEEEEAED